MCLHPPRVRGTTGQVTITDWTKYRQIPLPDTTLRDAEAWADHLRDVHSSVSKHTALLTSGAPVADQHPLHMWESRRSLIKRWKRQLLNRKLRLKVAEVSERANEYARKLETESWVQFCDSMRDT
ncbi:hypothetical protein HPB50_017270 [Hyalomma asiaticum]|uniref:Uncharacterized protein n=1 Tax=Hyalomma asiaticum TaxID=266040 RepID=A0ACB7SZQ4_HYAAI|nr:hypothetical protein HPB50_017270 [Hyalomma asiaticum]